MSEPEAATKNRSSIASLKQGIGKYVVAAGALAVLAIGCLLSRCNGEPPYKEIDLTEKANEAELRLTKPAREEGVLVFGFDLRGNLKKDVRQYAPFLKYLERATGCRFKLRFTRKDARIADDLGTGLVQFAAIGANTYIIAHREHGVIPLVRGLNSVGKAEYQSVIVTAPGSDIRKIEDVRGKRFAFGSITSTQGHLIPRIVLLEHGIALKDLASYGWTGSHYNCATAVAEGRFDAGGMQDTLGGELAEAGLIRIIYTSASFPSSGIAANKDVPADVMAKVKQALLDFDPKGRHAKGLYQWDGTEMPNGFTEAKDSDYAEFRDWAGKLGLLEETKRGETK